MNRLIIGDCRVILPTLEPGSVQMVCTSPPYMGLRDYGTAEWAGGDAECDHIEKRSARRDSPGGYHNSRNDRSGDRQPSTLATVLPYREACAKCGARRIDAQIGLEARMDCLGWATREPCGECYVCQMVQVFRLVWRVLADDGVVFLNLGDSYAGSSMSGGVGSGTIKGSQQGDRKGHDIRFKGARRLPVPGLKPKDTCGIPWRVAFALQADGWILRQDIIWSKKNPMPESTKDRFCKSHEYLFMFSKNRRYFFDSIAVSEPVVDAIREPMVSSKYGNGKDMPQVLANAAAYELLPEEERYESRCDMQEMRDSETYGMARDDSGARVLSQSIGTVQPLIARSDKAERLQSDRCAQRKRAEISSVGEGKGHDGANECFATTQATRFALYRHGEVQSHTETVSANTEGPGESFTWSPQAARSNGNHSIDADSGRMGSNQGEPGLQVCDLFTGERGPDPRPYHSIESGRSTHEGKHSSALSELQHQKGQSSKRLKRSVWTIATEPYAQAHFATFPQKLVEPCILAGSSERGHCPGCGKRWARVVERNGGTIGEGWTDHKADLQAGMSQTINPGGGLCNARDANGKPYTVETRGWKPGCTCGLDPIPDVVLDIFAGSNTVGRVAERLGRHWLGIELSAAYGELAKARTEGITQSIFL